MAVLLGVFFLRYREAPNADRVLTVRMMLTDMVSVG